jgi:hypothetical protein
MARSALLAILSLGALVGCQAAEAPPPTPAPVVQEERQVLATVEAVDPATRQLTLRGGDGPVVVLAVGPEVRNFAQIEVGDEVVVRYREAIAAALRKPGEPARVGEVTEQVTRAPQGARPAAEVERRVTTTVRIDQVEPTVPTVSFTGADGILRMINVRDPGMQAFARTLKPGDEVDITFSEALALSVEPAQ